MERLAPILITALTAGLALIPLAFGIGEPGNEIHAPLAVVVLGGLLTSTFLNMVVVPALFLRFGRLGNRKSRWRTSSSTRAMTVITAATRPASMWGRSPRARTRTASRPCR